MKKTKIVIAGGGFAGLSAAMYLDKTLARREEVEVTLINRENFILFTPMLHEVAAGDLYPGDIVNPLRRILRRVKFVEAEVQAIDLSARRVHCLGGVAQQVLIFGGSRRQNVRAFPFCELHGEVTDSAAAGVNQHALAWLQLRDVEQRLPRSQRGQRHRRCANVMKRVRFAREF
jgi:Pyridine nucleotide-disulphide oxidoreductase